MRLTFCGVRGSTPAPGAAYVRYGGHTSCIAVQADGHPVRLLLDAGTGMQNASGLVDGVFRGTVLLTHLHWDHTHGMPFFSAGGHPASRVHVLLPDQNADAHALLARCFSPPHFPILPRELGPGWSFASLDEGTFDVEEFEVLAREIPHKGGRTFGYRITSGPTSVAYLPDHSPTSLGPGGDGFGERHDAALELSRGANVLVHDAQHMFSEFPGAEYLGHACTEYAVALGREAGVETVVLFHHAPSRTDDEIDQILALNRADDMEVIAAAEGAVLDVGRRSGVSEVWQLLSSPSGLTTGRPMWNGAEPPQ